MHPPLRRMIPVHWDLHGGFKMKAGGPDRIQKCCKITLFSKLVSFSNPLTFGCPVYSKLDAQFVEHISAQFCLAVWKEWGKCSRGGRIATGFWAKKAPILPAVEIGHTRLLLKQVVLKS